MHERKFCDVEAQGHDKFDKMSLNDLTLCGHTANLLVRFSETDKAAEEWLSWDKCLAAVTGVEKSKYRAVLKYCLMSKIM